MTSTRTMVPPALDRPAATRDAAPRATGPRISPASSAADLYSPRARTPRLDDTWTPACAVHRLLPGRGVAVLLRGGSQAALFLLGDGSLRAVANVDPVGRAAVMSRGLVGDRAGEPTVASPLLKEVYSLIDGRCLDDPALHLPVHAIRVDDGVVSVGPPERIEAPIATL